MWAFPGGRLLILLFLQYYFIVRITSFSTWQTSQEVEFYLKKLFLYEVGMVVHDCNRNTEEAEATGSVGKFKISLSYTMSLKALKVT